MVDPAKSALRNTHLIPGGCFVLCREFGKFNHQVTKTRSFLALLCGLVPLWLGRHLCAQSFREDGKIKMIDQRLLPGEFVIAAFDSVAGVARSINEMYVRGAPAIGATGAFGMALAAQNSPATRRDDLLADLRAAKESLDAARPTAVNLSWATRRLLKLAVGPDGVAECGRHPLRTAGRGPGPGRRGRCHQPAHGLSRRGCDPRRG